MSRIKFKNCKPEDLTFVLCTRDYRKLGQLTGLKGVHYACHDNSPTEISFSLTRKQLICTNGNTPDDIKLFIKIKNALWEQIEDFKVIWVKETNEYFEIKVSTNDSFETSKTITGTPIPEAELSQILLSAEINTEIDISRDDYEITVFYDENNQNASLLHRLFTKATGYTIKHVDASLRKLQRMFSIADTYLYDFLVGECSEQFNCIFKFDSSDRSVSVYDLYTVCQDCGERGDYLDVCPNCGSTNLKYYGEDTVIYVDKDNLTDSITLEVNTDNVKNCFKLVAGDDYMTATIRNLNPSGSDYIYHIPVYLKKDMSKGLKTRLDEYDKLYNSRLKEYEQIVEEMYDLTDDIIYLESGMMPTIENSEVTASTEAEKLTAINLSPLGIYPLTTSTSLATVNSALKNYAKIYVKTGYVKLEVESDATYEYIGIDEDGWNYGTWYGRFKVVNYSDEEDVAYSDYITVKVYDNYQDFVEQKVMKNMTQDDEEGSLFDVLSIDELEDFKSALTYYGKNRLESFSDAIQSALDVLVSLDQASESADLYDVLYTPYYEKLQACRSELDIRQKQIDELQMQLDEKENQRSVIQKELDFESYLGEYYTEFSTYRRESVYSNDNYISDGLTNAEMIAKAKQFIEVAKEELMKSSEQQITITSTLYNLLLIPAFAPLVDKFETGNWIRIRVDGILYKLRLLGYEINFDDLKNLGVTFSNAQKVKEWNTDSEIQSILQSAKAMGQTYGYVAKQADKGSVAQDNIQNWMQNGLDSGLIQIKNNVNEEVTYSKHGLLCRSYDDIFDDYEDKQLKLTHNTIAFTDDNWRSVKTVLGENNYISYNFSENKWEQLVGYGLTSQYVMSGVIYGENEIIGGMIRSKNYSDGKTLDKDGNLLAKGGSYIDLNTGEFSFGGDSIYYRDGDFVISETVIGTALETIDIKAENLHIEAGNIEGQLIASQINTNGLIAENISGENIEGKNIIGGSLLIGDKTSSYAEITSDGVLNCSGANINGSVESDNLTVTGGDIGGWKIGSNGIYNDDIKCGFINLGAVRLYVGKYTYNEMLTISQGGSDKYPYAFINSEGLGYFQDMEIVNRLGADYISVYSDLSVNGTATAQSFTQTSLKEKKKNFEKLECGLEILNDIDIYKFNYQTESDETKKHIGFVIGDNYKYSEEVTSKNNDGADVYSLVSVCVKAIQELKSEIDELKGEINE